MTVKEQTGYVAFLEQLKSAPERILLLDYDGTLAPFQIDRDRAFPYPQVPPLLSKLMRTETRIVLVSGRPARELVRLSGIHPQPEIWGSHGLERLRSNGEYEVLPLSPAQYKALAVAAHAVSGASFAGRAEVKPGGVAVHWRGMDGLQMTEMKSEVMNAWSPLVAEYPLCILDFDGGIEIRAKGRDKGKAVDDILKEAIPGAAIAYLGDDITDEDAFRALKGKGLAALVRSEYRATSADIWLRPPDELIEFLSRWLHASGGEA